MLALLEDALRGWAMLLVALALQRALPFEVKQKRTAKTGGIWFRNVESPIDQTEFGHGCPLDLMPSKPCSKPQ